MNLPETTFGSSMISQERSLRADRAAISGSRFLTVLNTNAHHNTSQLLSDGCFMAIPVFARRTSSLPEEHMASNRSNAAWQSEQAEHSNCGPTSHAELHSPAIDERTMEHAQVGMPLAASQELLNTECVEMSHDNQRGSGLSTECRSAANDCDSEWEWVHVAN